MTPVAAIAYRCWLGDGRRHGIGRGWWRFDLACRQHFFDHGDDALEQPGLLEGIAAGNAHLAFRHRRALGGDTEGGRDHGLEFDDIGDVVDEAQRLASMQKADGRGVTRRQNRGFGNPVEAGGPRDTGWSEASHCLGS